MQMTSSPCAASIDMSLEVLNCRYGKMLAFRSDQVISKSLRLYGEWAEHELCCLKPYIKAGTTVVDVGAHIGTHTLPFATWVGAGDVVAIEPQPAAASVLMVNCLLNNRINVQVVSGLCGRRRSITTECLIDGNNLGSAAFKLSESVVDRIYAMYHRYFGNVKQSVNVLPLDEIVKGRTVSLIKVDAEGMELDVLTGAREILEDCHPAVFCEQNDTTNLAPIYDLLSRHGYRLYWLETHPFNQDNFRGQTNNIWWRTETGILALSRFVEARNDLIEVAPGDRHVPALLNAREGVSFAQHHGQ
jgi:FkbM family methyltransferase